MTKHAARPIAFLPAEWPAPPGLWAGTTLRGGGVSAPPFDSFNLGVHTGDDPVAVGVNRRRLVTALDLPGEPAWLDQNHGRRVVDADRPIAGQADAAIGTRAATVCAVLTADCLPVLLCDDRGTCWAAVHAGWRGLAAGVIDNTIDALPALPERLLAWLGPAIGPASFEVGAPVREAFCDRDPADATAFTRRAEPGKYLADIYWLARSRLRRAGVNAIYGGGWCTLTDADRFYSYRRAHPTGRHASIILNGSAPG